MPSFPIMHFVALSPVPFFPCALFSCALFSCAFFSGAIFSYTRILHVLLCLVHLTAGPYIILSVRFIKWNCHTLILKYTDGVNLFHTRTYHSSNANNATSVCLTLEPLCLTLEPLCLTLEPLCLTLEPLCLTVLCI